MVMQAYLPALFNSLGLFYPFNRGKTVLCLEGRKHFASKKTMQSRRLLMGQAWD